MTDQHRADVLGAAGDPLIKTPHLDALARDGALFTRAYTPCPVCTPARASLLTGRSLFATGIVNNDLYHSGPSETPFGNLPSYDERLHALGWFSTYRGKWHVPLYRAGLRTPSDTSIYDGFGYALATEGSWRVGTNEYQAYRDFIAQRAPATLADLAPGLQFLAESGRPYRPVPADRLYGKPPPDSLAERRAVSQGAVIGELILDPALSNTAWTRDRAIEDLRRAHASGKPFNVTLSINAPHPPLVATQPWLDLYRGKTAPLVPASHADRSPAAPYNLAGIVRHAQAGFADPDKLPDIIAVYYALVTEADAAIGAILQTLRDLGAYDDTLVIYTSDHGEQLGAHGLSGKGYFYEESVRVPLIVKPPRADTPRPGARIDTPVTTTDLFATILDYTAGVTDAPSDGASLRDLLEGRPRPGAFAVSQWGADGVPPYCVVTARHKLLASRWRHVKSALYDLAADPAETNNLLLTSAPAQLEALRPTVAALHTNLLAFMSATRHPDLARIRAFDYLTNTRTDPAPQFIRTAPAAGQTFLADFSTHTFTNLTLSTRGSGGSVPAPRTGKNRRSRRLPPAAELAFDIPRAVLYDESAYAAKRLAVTFLDEGSEPFELQAAAPDGDIWKVTRHFIQKENTRQWVTRTLDLPDALFFDRFAGGADFRILGSKTEDTFISAVSFTLH
jgi:arylsulfatase A-like enzyme